MTPRSVYVTPTKNPSRRTADYCPRIFGSRLVTRLKHGISDTLPYALYFFSNSRGSISTLKLEPEVASLQLYHVRCLGN